MIVPVLPDCREEMAMRMISVCKKAAAVLFLSACGGIFISPCRAEPVEIRVNPPRELDFLSREDVFKVRLDTIKKYPQVYNKPYSIEGPVFDQVVSGKAWWGFIGLNCRGPGENCIRGRSRESINIDNPFVLINLLTGAFRYPNWHCSEEYPQPVRIVVEPEQQKYYVSYDFSSYYNMFANHFQTSEIPFRVFKTQLSGANARDLGWPYIYAEAVKNIKFTAPGNVTRRVYELRDYIHLASNCGYSDSCNNGSPEQPALEMEFTDLPAAVRFKLWENEPVSPEDPADATYEIRFY